jgi:hypothetical protein
MSRHQAREMTDQAKIIYPIYLEFSQRFHLELVPCGELESPALASGPQAQEPIARWFRAADDRIEVPHIREFLSQSQLGEGCLRGLLAHHLGKEPKDKRDRDKIDFLLVHYLAECLPVNAPAQKLSFAQAAEVLEPVLGENRTPKRLAGLEDCIQDLEQCRTLSDLVDRWILERGHAVKVAVHEKPFDVTTLVAFARFSFLMRLGAIRLLHEDLRTLEHDLQDLETRGVSEVEDIPGVAKKASVGSLRNLCEKWKHYFPGKYSQNQWFTDVISVRHSVQQTLENKNGRTAGEPNQNQAPSKKTVGAQSTGSYPGAATGQGAQLEAEVERYMHQIAEQVQSPMGGRASSVAAIDLDGLRLMLSTGEVDAFQEPCEGISLVLQHAVAVRAVLLAALERSDTINLQGAVEVAQAKIAALELLIPEVKQAGDLNAVVNLRACDRSLRKVLEKMDKSLLSPAPGEALTVTPSTPGKQPKRAEPS